MPVEISRYSFRVFVCACPFVISSIPGKSFHFTFPLFVMLSKYCSLIKIQGLDPVASKVCQNISMSLLYHLVMTNGDNSVQ